MHYDFRFGEKAQEFLRTCDDYRTNILQGSVRSGKTVLVCYAWLNYILQHKGCDFLMSAQSTSSLHKNVAKPFLNICEDFGIETRFHKDSSFSYVIELPVTENIIHLQSLRDKKAHEKIKGATYTGWYCDEVTSCDKNAVSMCLTRCDKDDTQIFWTTNPDSPYNFVYQDYILPAKDKDNVKVWTFYMDDNIHLSEAYKEDMRNKWPRSSVFYRRYILSEWCLAEGLIYDNFNREAHVSSVSWDEVNPSDYDQLVIGCDYGGVTVFGACLRRYDESADTWDYFVVEESYYDNRKKGHNETDVQRIGRLKGLINRWGKGLGRNIHIILPHDTSANLYSAVKSDNDLNKYNTVLFKPDTLDEIEKLNQLFYMDSVRIHESCEKTIQQVETYSWDNKYLERGINKPLKIDDHACDMLRGCVYDTNTSRLRLEMIYI